MNKQLESILTRDDKKTNEAGNVPAKLLRKILSELNITPSQWEYLVNNYYKSSYSSIAKNKVAIASDKNNFNRAIAKNDVTWAKIMRALLILSPVKITFSIKMQWRSGLETEHSQVVHNHMKKLIEENNFEPDSDMSMDMHKPNVLGDQE